MPTNNNTLNWARLTHPNAEHGEDGEDGEDCEHCSALSQNVIDTLRTVLDAATRAESPIATLAALRLAAKAFSETLTTLLKPEDAARILDAAKALSKDEVSPEIAHSMTAVVADSVTRHSERTAELSDEECERYRACIDKASRFFGEVMSDTAGPAEACVVTHLLHVIARQSLLQQKGEQAIADIAVMEHRATPPHMELHFLGELNQEQEEPS